MPRLTPAEYTATVEKIAKVNARAAKRGFTGRVTLAAERTVEVVLAPVDLSEAMVEVEVVRYNVTVTGEAPCYGGWVFLALLDWDQHAGLIVRTAPGVESVDREGLAEGSCGHCNTNRRRHKTMLVRNAETGAQMQVGTTCIKDFLGWDTMPVFLYADEIKVGDDAWTGSYAADLDFTVDTVLGLAWAATMAYGFVPTSGMGLPTRDAVALALGARKLGKGDREVVEGMRGHLAAATAKGRECREFLLSEAFTGNSEYVRNLKAVAGAEYVSLRNLGLLASAPQAWAKAQEKSLVKERETLAPSEWFGAKGDKVEFTGTIKVIRWIDGQFGSTTLYILVAEDGREVKWFSSAAALGNTEGATVTIRGTIKGHDEYEGRKSTVLTRCKVLAPASA